MSLGTNFLLKVAQMYSDTLGYFEKHHFHVKTAVATFWASLGIIWATVCCNTCHKLLTTKQLFEALNHFAGLKCF